MTDHANKKGKGFFAKVISWCAKQTDDWKLHFFCLDIDNCDHTAKGAARAVQLALKRLGLRLGIDINIELLCGDSGGGAAVQRLGPELKCIKIMTSLGRSAKCLMHALNKAFEMACLHCFGKQGVNIRSIYRCFSGLSSKAGQNTSITSTRWQSRKCRRMVTGNVRAISTSDRLWIDGTVMLRSISMKSPTKAWLLAPNSSHKLRATLLALHSPGGRVSVQLANLLNNTIL